MSRYDPQEEEPPSYNHAVQASLSQDNIVYEFGKYRDASRNSFEQGEMFTQAFRAQIDTFPHKLVGQVTQHGLVNVLQLDETPHSNELFRHPKASSRCPPIRVEKQQLTFWPDRPSHCPPEDWEITAQATHPYLSLSDYTNAERTESVTHYFEITVESMASDVLLAIGLATQPYPLFRVVGWNRFSVGYHSDDGRKFCDDATGGQDYGPSWTVGDTVGCGYQPEAGNIFFTLNGRIIDYAFVGLEKHNYFASISADGPARVRVNFGQVPFIYAVGDSWAGTKI
ncbi:Rsp5p-dependent ubiquitination, sorting of cargo proteins at the multivesicular body [Apophysomyces sp. BC1034]|nr:Rsp5p-dependent ubiquitination, sorting of cargo proteins at the multivesicular body [Apophysomyces sp. BC1015]KAG0180301.1 Rsp5p-dependent ubiquitination, sorting of cargo proteins at the multivesicular body [Apophysomyces sp. BC1021]KAG0194800.1 Rsp5p-dependent ubiquitination, sorting of cargo proteins at the multivesicular body [Apophysomyces sp. BC1034]